MTFAENLAAEFVDGEVLQFQGRGGKTFDYIEDETVMDRLDQVLGVGNWSVTVEPISVADGIVKVRLAGRTPEGAEFTHEDFGYQTRDGGEGLKEAVSDGIRRCGRYLGVGRYLYRKHETTPSGTGRADPSPVRPAAPPRPTVVRSDGPEFPPNEWEAPVALDHRQLPVDPRDGGTCPEHGTPWTLKPAGISKAGKEYDAFWKCDGRNDDGSYCKGKPSKAWQARHEA